ncbi:MAG: class I SAM-dependent methyltransferase [Flavobacteriales bacterium]
MEKVNKKNTEWFEYWFDSPFYHILYKNRDDKEAQAFISNLITLLNPNKESLFVDVACGKGRHAMFLNSLGYTVDGFDLSENSITNAQLKETSTLQFFTNDIREPLKRNHYDFAFNLFTSFGYFDDENDNQKAINAIAESLNTNGILVLDFMNSIKVIQHLNKQETKEIDTIKFNIKRSFTNGHIVKDINFEAENIQYQYQEKVKSISLEAFKNYFLKANLTIDAIFGDYDLNPFELENSDRLILVARKK